MWHRQTESSAAENIAVERSCACDNISALPVPIGLRPVGHICRKGKHHNDTSHNGRVCKVLTDAAEKLLYNDYRNNRADSRLPQRDGHGQVEREQKSGDNRAQVAESVAALHDSARQILGEHTGAHRYEADEQNARAEEPN